MRRPLAIALAAAVGVGVITQPTNLSQAVVPDGVQIQTGQAHKPKGTRAKKPKVRPPGDDPLKAAITWNKRMDTFVKRQKAREAAKAARQAERQAEREAAREAAAQRVRDALAPTRSVPQGGNRAIGHRMMLDAGWGEDQWTYLDKLWTRESGWSHTASNPSSGAYGIPQSLPGSKMATAGADWQTNPATQIRWGLNYIKGRYGSPQNAWAHSEAVGWY